MIFSRSKFKGGIHPKDHKEISRGSSILTSSPGEEVVIPLTQHIGAPATVTVKKGDHLNVGDIIGTPSGFVSSFIHSSVTGTVKDIDIFPHSSGKKILSVVITPDKDAEIKGSDNKEDISIENISSKDIIDNIQKAGIVGMGGASFPTHVKLLPPKGKKIDTLIINAAECEPYLTADETLIINNIDGIKLGAKLIQKAVNAKKIIIAIEDNKPNAIEKLKNASLSDAGIELNILPTRYPQGGEKQLIEAVLNKQVPSGGLPMDTSTLVQNIATSFAVYEAIYYKKPLIERLTTVTGDSLKKPGTYKVKIGTKLKDILREAGYDESSGSLVIMGGPMMGSPVLDLETPVIKATSGILVLDKIPMEQEYPCIRCGRCIFYCPIGLSTTEIPSAYNNNDIKQLQDLHVMDCIECGCCSYICPAGIPLVHYLKLAKVEIRKNARKQ
ncbi:MAG: electron transport complex subunit RsxC [Candidatus Aureabacteria bacterium]|nr:electron transport complex subunit RsxC [Candidatus Auribacterota bacterium]